MTPAQRVKELTKSINYHNRKYYVEDKPEIPDGEYDKLYHELLKIEKEHPDLLKADSPTQKVGDDTEDTSNKLKHDYLMLSIANAFTEEELKDFLEDKFPVYVDVKYDGMSLSLVYIGGKLAKAITRGDGEKGDDVTRQARLVSNIPHVIKTDEPVMTIRGEIVMKHAVFEDLNANNAITGDRIYSNPRNAAAGVFRSLHRHKGVELTFYAYNAFGGVLDIHSNTMKLVKKLGFESLEGFVANSLKECVKIYKTYLKKRDKMDFDIDGVVYKKNILSQSYMASIDGALKSKYVTGVIAYKFPALEVMTVLNGISWQVGRFGTLTPVGNLVPVDIDGVTVSNVSLHNISEIHKKDVRLGDTVIIKRSGDVIPYLVGPVLSKRPEPNEVQYIGVPVRPIQVCPSCGDPVTFNTARKKGVKITTMECVNNRKCPDQLIGQINNFVSRDALDVDGVSIERITELYKKGYIRKASDLYKVTYFQLEGLSKMGKASMDNYYKSHTKSLSTELHRFLYGLGIPNTGRRMCRLLATKFRTLDAIMNASIVDLEAIETIGPVKARSIRDFFILEENRKEVEELLRLGFHWDTPKKEVTGGILSGKKFVITGSFDKNRNEVKEVIENAGGKVTSSVTSSTTAVIAGDKPGGSKMKKAKTMKMKVLNEKEIDKLLDKLIEKGVKLW